MMIENIFMNVISHKIVYLIIFLVTLFEAIPPIGIFIPGQIFIMLAGFAAQRGFLNLGLVILISIMAAILGDLVAYEMGKRFGLKFLRKYGKYFFLKEEYLQNSEKFMRNHLSKAIISGRLYSVTRVFVPFLAGVHKANFRRFMLANITGAIIWATVSVLIGFIFGEGFRIIERVLGFLFTGIFILGILIYFLYRYISIKKKILSGIELSLVLTLITGVALLFIIIDSIKERGMLSQLDIYISKLIPFIHNNFMIQLSLIIEFLFSTWMVLIYSIIIMLYLIFTKKSKEYIMFGSIISLTGFLVFLFKNIIHRPRPILSYAFEPGFSFPSGHATTAAVFFGLIIYFILISNRSSKTKYLEVIGSLFTILLIGLSRVYLNVHYLSDVVAGFILGSIVLISALIYLKIRERKLFSIINIK
jgi:membrane protein DedA with SNARE-associated domain